MGGTLGRVVNTYADSDDDQLPLGVELVEANRHGEADFALEIPPAQVMPPGPVSPLLFGGNIFPNGDPSHPTREVMLPLLRRLASNTPQLSHTRTVICPFNVNKGSIKLIPRNSSTDMSVSSNLYDLYFTLDATEPCIVKVFYCVDEIFSNGSLEYSDATSGTKIGVVPSLAGSPQPPRSHDGSPFSNPPKYIEQRFGIGLGQEFSTSGSEALDTTNYPVTNLTWNQLEQQAEADRAQARISEGNSNESDSDAEASENENAEDEAAEEGDVERPEAIDEEQGLPVRRSQRRSRRGRKRSLPAAPRPKPAEQPIVVRNLFPIVISIEPQLNGDVLLQKPVVEAQITHACLVSSPLSMESPVTDANQASSSSGDMKYDCKVLRQKLLVNSAVYNVYDIFGVEQVTGDDSMQSTCVICMSEPRTTLVIPCRHMCLCEDCAETLKVQSVKCPICRGPVRSLMKIEVSMEDNDDDGSEKGANDKSMAPKRSPKQSENGRAQHALQLEEVDSNEDEDNEDDDEDDEDDDNVNASLVRSK